MNGESKYNDIINLPHHVSEKRNRMSNYDRAAQFSPFAALTGHSDALQETARLTDAKAELDESEKVIISEKLQMIINELPSKVQITVTYFVPDSRKSGGAYVKTAGFIKKLDTFMRKIIMSNGISIPIDNIFDIEIPKENISVENLYL